MRICRIWKRFLVWREKQRRASPSYVASLAREVAHLIELSEVSVLPEQRLRERPKLPDLSPLRMLRREMEAMAEYCMTGEFGRLSRKRRLALAARLGRTRRFVISTMQEGSPPTQRVQ